MFGVKVEKQKKKKKWKEDILQIDAIIISQMLKYIFYWNK